MKPVRQVMLALQATLALAGCRTAGVGNLTRPEPIAPPSSLSARGLIAEHNRNAKRIQSFEAKPSITIRSEQMSGGISGMLALERPRSFKLDLFNTIGSKIGDIGSNDAEFWFWTKDGKQRAIYYCNYDDLASSSLAATFQPDWIVEAMGLRIIPEEEADEITVRRGTEPGTLVLTHRPTKSGGQTFTRVTILDESTRRIKVHKLFSGDQKVLLAQATVTGGYQSVPITSAAGETGEAVFVPRALKLDWVQEKLALEVTLNQAKAGKEGFKQSRREALFVEPKLGRGFERINLAKQAETRDPPEQAETRDPPATTVRETLPAPPTRVRLGEPTPLGLDETGTRPGDPGARADDDLPPRTAPVERYIGPRIPSPPEPESVRAAATSGWHNVPPSSFER
ncbi:MAG: hypothetical protein ACM35G_03490 [Planctomycetaceae bacterium]